MKNKVFKSLVSAVAGSFLMIGVASAGMLSGGISFIGFGWSAIMDADNVNVVGIDFDPNTGFGGSGFGDLLVLNGKNADIYDITFNPWVVNTPIWQVDLGENNIFKFNLNDISVEIEKSLTGGLESIKLEGIGTISAPNFDDTVGNWSLTAQTEPADGGATFGWSSSTAAAAPVPEPATMLLFGTGLVGLAGAARRRKAAK